MYRMTLLSACEKRWFGWGRGGGGSVLEADVGGNDDIAPVEHWSRL